MPRQYNRIIRQKEKLILNGIHQHAKIAAVKIGSADGIVEQGVPAKNVPVYINADAALGMTRRLKNLQRHIANGQFIAVLDIEARLYHNRFAEHFG